MREPTNSIGRRRILAARYAERLRELDALGAESTHNAASEVFSDYETLEYLLMQKIGRGEIAPIARSLMQRFGSTAGVLTAERKELLAMPGISQETHAFIRFVAEVGSLAKAPEASEEPSDRTVLKDVREAAVYCKSLLAGRGEERMLQVLMGPDSRVIAAFFVAAGGEGGVSIPADIIAENAVLSGASGVVLAHNHPSGSAEPSVEDVASTRRLADVLIKKGVRLFEHFVVSDTACFAMFANERIDFAEE